MKKYLLFFGIVFLTSHTYSQIIDYKKVYINECMANRKVTKDNEKYQIAFCNDKANLETQNLKIQAKEKSNDARVLLKESMEFKNNPAKLKDFESDAGPLLIEKYNKLNDYQNPYLSAEYRQLNKTTYQNLKEFSNAVIQFTKNKITDADERTKKCNSGTAIEKSSTECSVYTYHFVKHSESSLTLNEPK